jgi:hypothetical protein
VVAGADVIVLSVSVHREEYPGSRNSYNNGPGPGDYGGPQSYNDSYADHPSYGQGYSGDYQDDRDLPQGGPPYDDSFHQSPYHGQDYPPPNGRDYPPPNGRLEDDYHLDRQNDSLPPRHDDSFQGRPGDPPAQYGQGSFDQDRYSDSGRQPGGYDSMDPNSRYRGSYDNGPEGYQGPVGEGNPRYRGSYDQEDPSAPYPPDDNPPPRYMESYDPRGQGPPSGQFNDSYDPRGQGPPSGQFNGPPPDEGDPRYRGSYQDAPPDAYNDSHRGLPTVQADPFADDPFRDQRSHDGSFRDDLYNRGPPSPREDPYSRGPPSPRDDPYNRGPSPRMQHGGPSPYGPESLPVGGSDFYGDPYYGEYSLFPSRPCMACGVGEGAIYPCTPLSSNYYSPCCNTMVVTAFIFPPGNNTAITQPCYVRQKKNCVIRVTRPTLFYPAAPTIFFHLL